MNDEQKAWLALMKSIITTAETENTVEAYEAATEKLNQQLEVCPEP